VGRLRGIPINQDSGAHIELRKRRKCTKQQVHGPCHSCCGTLFLGDSPIGSGAIIEGHLGFVLGGLPRGWQISIKC